MKKTLLVLAIAMSLASPVAAGPPTSWTAVQAIAVEVKGDGLNRICTLVNVTRTTESGEPVTVLDIEVFVTLNLNTTGLWGCTDRVWLFREIIPDSQFVVNGPGTEATLTHPEATVIFKSAGDFAVLSDTTRTVRNTLTGTDQSYRLVVREDWYHAEGQGVVRGAAFDSFTYPAGNPGSNVNGVLDGVGRLVTTKTWRKP
jgi:hypothetical protein